MQISSFIKILHCLQNFLITFHRDQIYSVKSIVLVAYIVSDWVQENSLFHTAH